jgi:hypothetical protein
MVQAASVGWKDEQKPFAFDNPFNDLSSQNLLAAMLSGAFFGTVIRYSSCVYQR